MTAETVKVRVVDLVFDADDRPVLDEHPDPGQRKQRRNGGGYLYHGINYLPGDTIEMPAKLAREELKSCGFSQDAEGRGGRHALLEPLEWYERRLAKQEAVQKDREQERQAFVRMSKELESERAQQRKLQDLIVERERLLAERDRQRHAEVSEAKAEVPPEVAADLLEAKRLREEAERRYLEQSEQMRALQQRLAAIELANTEAKAPKGYVDSSKGTMDDSFVKHPIVEDEGGAPPPEFVKGPVEVYMKRIEKNGETKTGGRGR